MSGATAELNLATAVDGDDNADYLTLALASSLRTLDALFNNVTGHTHAGAHQGGPVNSIPVSAIPDGSITSVKITDGTIATVDLADGSVTSAKIADGTIQTVDLAAGIIGNAQLAPNAVTTDKIADGTIQTADIAPGAITSGLIADGTIQSADLAAGLTLTSPTISGATITGSTITTPSGDAPVSGTGPTPLRVESGTSTSPSIASGSGAQISVSFARAFNSPPRVIAAVAATAGQDVANKFGGSDNTTVTTSGFSWHAYYTGGGNGTVSVNWLAIGN